MKSKLLTDEQNEKIFVLVFDTGDEILTELLRFAKEKNLSAAHFTAIGACERVTFAFFDLERKEYEKIPVNEQVEVMSLLGNIAVYDGEPKIHAHIVVGQRNGTALGGHLIDAVVRPTLEMFLTVSAEMIKRSLDETTNLPLIDLEAE
jgi:uncharacterized protein